MGRNAFPDRICGLAMSAAATPSLVATVAEGCAVTAHAGAGVYAVTLEQPIDATESFAIATARDATPHICSYVHTSDTVKTVYVVTNAGVAADIAFDFVVFRIF